MFRTATDEDEIARSRGRANRACVVGVPSAIAIADFCRFVAGAMATTRRVRVVAGRERSTYDVVMEFADDDAAETFVENYHGRKYASGRAETCVAVRVERVDEGGEASAALGTEVPTCPVCLDRLDAEASGIVTTICDHAFHAECLSGWADASCPVCRYAHEPESKARCATCGKDHDLVGVLDLRRSAVRTLRGGVRGESLDGDESHVLARAGDAARVGLRLRWLRAPVDSEQERTRRTDAAAVDAKGVVFGRRAARRARRFARQTSAIWTRSSRKRWWRPNSTPSRASTTCC